MGFKDDAVDMLSDFVILIERQVGGYGKSQLLELITFLGTDSSGNLPDLFLGEDMKTVFFKFSNGKKEKITEANLKTCMDYIAFLKHGIIDDADSTERRA